MTHANATETATQKHHFGVNRCLVNAALDNERTPSLLLRIPRSIVNNSGLSEKMAAMGITTTPTLNIPLQLDTVQAWDLALELESRIDSGERLAVALTFDADSFMIRTPKTAGASHYVQVDAIVHLNDIIAVSNVEADEHEVPADRIAFIESLKSKMGAAREATSKRVAEIRAQVGTANAVEPAATATAGAAPTGKIPF